MKKYFTILSFLFSFSLVTAQPSERLSLSDFNLKGKVKSITEKQYRTKKNGKAEAAAFEEITYSFNEKGLLEQWESKNSGSKYYKYDENGRATSMIFEGVESYALKYVYEEDAKTRWQLCYWQSGHGARIGNLQYQYLFIKDNSGRLAEYAKYNSTRTIFNFKEVYTYNTKNQVEEIKNYVLSGKLSQRYTFIYDNNNNTMEIKEYNYTNIENELNSTAKFEYKYDSDNNWTEMFKKVDLEKSNSKEYIKTVRIIEYYEETN